VDIRAVKDEDFGFEVFGNDGLRNKIEERMEFFPKSLPGFMESFCHLSQAFFAIQPAIHLIKEVTLLSIFALSNAALFTDWAKEPDRTLSGLAPALHGASTPSAVFLHEHNLTEKGNICQHNDNNTSS